MNVPQIIAGALMLVLAAAIIGITAAIPAPSEGPIKAETTRELIKWIGYPLGFFVAGAGVRLVAYGVLGETRPGMLEKIEQKVRA